MKKSYHLVFFLLVLFIPNFVQAQEISTFLKQKAFTLNGSLSGTMNGYSSSTFNPNIRPFGYSLNGNINIGIYGFIIPINVFVTDMVNGYQIPFSLVGASPTYKRWTFHAGIRNLNWGQFALAGAPITGGGLEYNGNKFRFGFIYGRLAKAVAEDTLQPAQATPSFERWGWAAKMGFGSLSNSFDITILRAADNLNSLPYVPVKADIQPRENLVTSLSWKKAINRYLRWDAEVASSIFTRDTRAASTDLEKDLPGIENLFWIYQPRLSTQFYFAGLTGLSFQYRNVGLRFQYKRVDNDFTSLGAVFIQNDVEEYSGSLNLGFWANKIRFNVTGGQQRDNLNFTKASTSKRVIASGNVSFNPVKWYGLDVSYSNFLTDQQQTARRLFDTARTALVNENLSISQRFSFNNPVHARNFMVMLNRAAINDLNPTASRNSSGQTLSAGLSFSYSHLKRQMGMNLSLNYNQTSFRTIDASFMGANAGLNKTFFNGKLGTSINLGYGFNYANGEKKSGNLNGSFNANCNLAKKTSLAMSVFVMNNEAISLTTPGSGETRASLTITQGF